MSKLSGIVAFLRRVLRELWKPEPLGMSMPGPLLSQRVRRMLGGSIVPHISRTQLAVVTITCLLTATIFGTGTLVRAQTKSVELRFEVATVRPLPGNSFRAAIDIAGSRVNASGPLAHLITVAYNVKDYQLSGLPDSPQLYQVIAKAEGDRAPTMDQARSMLRSLLAERFKLSLHPEIRALLVYRLVVGNAAKLEKSAPDAKFDLYMDFRRDRPNKLAGTISMASFVNQLTSLFSDRPVIDHTGLTGLYDLKLDWAPLAATEPVEGPSLFTAIQEQLGLKLEAARDPFQVLAIDHIEKLSEN